MKISLDLHWKKNSIQKSLRVIPFVHVTVFHRIDIALHCVCKILTEFDVGLHNTTSLSLWMKPASSRLQTSMLKLQRTDVFSFNSCNSSFGLSTPPTSSLKIWNSISDLALGAFIDSLDSWRWRWLHAQPYSKECVWDYSLMTREYSALSSLSSPFWTMVNILLGPCNFIVCSRHSNMACSEEIQLPAVSRKPEASFTVCRLLTNCGAKFKLMHAVVAHCQLVTIHVRTLPVEGSSSTTNILFLV